MRRIPFKYALALAALWAFPHQALAADAAGPPEGEEEELEMVIEDEMEGEEPAPEGEAGAEAPPAGLDGLLEEEGQEEAAAQIGTGGGGGDEVGKADKNSEEKQIKAEMGLITVVQRQRMLKKKRFDLQPQFGISVNDPYVRHYALGAEFNFWFHNRMAVGINGTGFIGAKTPRYSNVRQQLGLLLTANQVLWQASATFLYNAFYGKIAIFNRALMHWEAYLQVGGGGIHTRVIPRYESLHDPFDNITGQGNIGLGTRFYLPAPINWVSINAGVRHFLYPDLLEPFQRGPSTQNGTRSELDPPDAAKSAADSTLGQLTYVFIGVSFYLPPSFEYTTPR